MRTSTLRPSRRTRLARAYRKLSAYERGQAIWRGDARAQAHVAEVAVRVEHELRTRIGRFSVEGRS